jgi:hypothetical protein
MLLATLAHLAEGLDHTLLLIAQIEKSVINSVGTRRLEVSIIVQQFVFLLTPTRNKPLRCYCLELIVINF